MSISKFHYLEHVRVISNKDDLLQIYDRNAKVIDMEIEGYSEWHYTIEIDFASDEYP